MKSNNLYKNNFLNKTFLLMIFLMAIGFSKAQIAIGKQSTEGNNTILDFGTGTTNGIILPIVETLPTEGSAGLEGGTFLMDKNDLKLKMYDGTQWVALSDAGSISAVTFNTSAEKGDGVIFGNNTTTAKGVLVLESTDKAMILPKVASPETNIKSPYPGTMCYDTTSKSVAIFDGLKWNYWK